MTKSPGFWFFTGDWLKDPELRFCSIFARGLLVDLLCYMFEAKEQGYMCTPTGKPMTNEQIVDAVSGSTREEKLAGLQELEENGVLSRDSRGVLYSRRLSRLKEVSAKRREAGSKGGSKTQAKRKQTDEQNDKQKRGVTDSDSASVSDSDSDTDSENTKPPKSPKGDSGKVSLDLTGVVFPKEIDTPWMREAVRKWVAFRRQRKPAVTMIGLEQTLGMLSRMPADVAIASIYRTIAKNWQGIQTCPPEELALFTPKEVAQAKHDAEERRKQELIDYARRRRDNDSRATEATRNAPTTRT